MKNKLNAFLMLISSLGVSSLAIAQQTPTPPPMPPQATEFYTPVPPKVTPGAMNNQAPSDAIVLFDGSSLSGFVSAKDGSSTAPWKIEKGELVVQKGTGDIQSKLAFGERWNGALQTVLPRRACPALPKGNVGSEVRSNARHR